MLIRKNGAVHTVAASCRCTLSIFEMHLTMTRTTIQRRHQHKCLLLNRYFHTTAVSFWAQKDGSSQSEDHDATDAASMSLLHEMRKYASAVPLENVRKHQPPADGKQTVIRNSMFLQKLKAILKQEAEEEMAQGRRTGNGGGQGGPQGDSQPPQKNARNSQIRAPIPPPQSTQALIRQRSLTASIIDLYHENFESSRNCNENSISVYINKRRNKRNTPQFQKVVPPDERSVSILFFPFKHPRFCDLFDFQYFVTTFLYDIFLYQVHMLSEGFLDEIFQQVVVSNQMVDEGLILFQLYANHIYFNRFDDTDAKKHLFKCFVLILRESIKLENSFAMKTLLDFGEKHYRRTMMESLDEELTKEHQNQLCICLMDLYARSGDMDAALQLLRERILTPSITNDTLNQVLTTLLIPYTTTPRKKYTLEERKDMVNTILNKLPDSKIHDVVIVDMILGWYIADRDWNKCRELIERLFNLDEGLSGDISTLSHDTRIASDQRLVPVYMSLVKIFLVYASFGDANLLEKYYTLVAQKMSRKDHTRLANFILLAHLKSQNAEKSLLRFQELFASKWQVNRQATCEPDVDTWKIVLQACQASGSSRMYEQVQELLNLEMMKEGKGM